MAGRNNILYSADEAYAVAEKRIAQAARESATVLALSDLESLNRLPPLLANLTALRILDLNGTQVSDLAPLANLTELQTLLLHQTKVSDLAPLGKLTALESVSLAQAQVSNLAPLANLTALRNLALNGTQVSDLSPLANLTALQTLLLNETQVSDLAPLANLTALQTLSLDGTQVSDLAPLANLTALQGLWLNGTQVSYLAALANLTALQGLWLNGTQVSDLAPLANLTALQQLDLDGTQVSDLAPLANLTALRALYLSETQVSDLAPLAHLTALRYLWLNGTQVSDLAPLANLTALQILDLNGTQVSDLAPLVNATALADGARDKSSQGLHFKNCPLTDEMLLAFADLENPGRTIGTLNYLRRKQGLPLIGSDLKASAEPNPKSASHEGATPPSVPRQGVGPKFRLKPEGRIGLAPPGPIDSNGNDTARLRALHEPLRETARDLVESLGHRPNRYPRLTKAAQKYLDHAGRDLDKIDFDALYGVGLQLDIAIENARDDIKNGIDPPFDPGEEKSARNLMAIHGPFILASAQGRELLADAERYATRREDLPHLRQEAAAVGKHYEARDDLFEPDASGLISDLAELIGQGPHPERSVTFTLDAIANLTVTLGELSIALVIATGLNVAGIVALGGSWAYLRSRPEGQDAIRWAKDTHDRLRAPIVEKLRHDVPHFLLRQEPHLRRLSQYSVRLHFVNALLDWLHEEVGKKSDD